MVPDGRSPTRRSFLLAAGTAGLGSLAGCRSLTKPAQQRWSYDTESRIVDAPAIADGVVFVATRDFDAGRGRVHAVDAEGGERRWRMALQEPAAAPELFRDLVLVGTEDGLVALDRDDGSERWRVDTGERVTRLATAGDTCYASGDGIMALDPAGELRWQQETPVRGPLAAGGLAVVASVLSGENDQALAAFHPDDGTERWRASVRTGRLSAPYPLVGGDRVYAVGRQVTAFDAATGAARSAFDPGERESLLTPPVRADGLHVGSAVLFDDRDYGTVFSLSDGDLGYEFRAPDSVSALAGDEAGLFARVGETVHAIDSELMTGRWSVDLGRVASSGLGASLAATDGTCYVALERTNRLVALAGAP